MQESTSDRNNVVAFQIVGGLGNQYFQYATGRAIALHHKAKLVLDTSWYDHISAGDTRRDMQLKNLRVNVARFTNVSQEPLEDLHPNVLQNVMRSIARKRPLKHSEKKNFAYDPSIIDMYMKRNENHYFTGYWQSYRYFDSIRSHLVNELQPVSALTQDYARYIESIQSSEAVMVHVRHGDYLSHLSYHYVLNIEYYLAAMKRIHNQFPNAHFFVFSDDIAWCQKNFPKEYKITFIISSNDPDANIQEIFLMSHCKHYIIANSSFSWWGAWLRRRLDGLVFAPQRWIADAKLNLDDLLPPDWQRLPA